MSPVTSHLLIEQGIKNGVLKSRGGDLALARGLVKPKLGIHLSRVCRGQNSWDVLSLASVSWRGAASLEPGGAAHGVCKECPLGVAHQDPVREGGDKWMNEPRTSVFGT